MSLISTAHSSPRWLLSFDFDGTLHDPRSRPAIADEFFAELSRLVQQHQARWGINTGRSYEHILEGMADEVLPLQPDWLITSERDIYLRHGEQSWQAHQPWNQQAQQHLHDLLQHAHDVLREIRHLVHVHTGATWIEERDEPAGIISQSEAEMEWIVSQIVPLTSHLSELHWQRNSIYLRFCHRDYHKGSGLAAVAQHWNIPRERIFAIGDSHNDLDKLLPNIAGLLACPANAIEPVKQQIRQHGGYLARKSCSEGVAEALRHFFPATIDAALAD